MIENNEYVIKKTELRNIADLPELLKNKIGFYILRWFISKVTKTDIFVEVTFLKEEKEKESAYITVKDEVYPGKNLVLSIIPTGIGCDIGGYAADAAPATALLASCSDYLITNPNAVNASDFILLKDNVLYTEGFIIDSFSMGLVNLYIPYSNRVGLIIEKTSDRNLEVIFNLLNTVRAVHGVNIEHYMITEKPIGGCCVRNKSGSYVGGIENPDVLFKACESLLTKGVNAIAITSNIKDLPAEDYARHFEGKHPNPTGGAEAVISHLICKKYKVPAAHAPLINIKDLNLKSNIVDARGAGEFSSVSGLACVLAGLRKAPQISKAGSYRIEDIVNFNNLLAVVAPATALGGIPVMYADRHDIPVIAVKNNGTILDITQSKLNLNNVIEVSNYLEAAGVIQALRKGIEISSVLRPLETLRF